MHDPRVDDRILANEFGAQLRQVRNRRGLSQDQLAKAAELSRTSIVNIEAGRQGVALGTVYRLAEALAVAPAHLLPDAGPPSEVPPIAIGGSTDESEQIVRNFMRDLETGGLPDDGQVSSK
jgi:transcriptional regulator with XRE-family HTH domain